MKSKNKSRVALYIRTSVEEQERSTCSPDFQEKELRAFCSIQGHILDEKNIYQDIGCSGISEVNERTGLKKLLDDAKKGEFEIVVVYKIERLSCKLISMIKVLEQLREHGVAFQSAIEFIDTSSEFGDAMFHTMGVFAEMERDIGGRKRCCCERT